MNNNEQTAETTTVSHEQEGSWPQPCEDCGKLFKSPSAMRMHRIRTHSNRGWDTSKNFKHRSRKRKKTRYPLGSPQYRVRKYREAKARRLLDKSLYVLGSTETPNLNSVAVNYCPHCGTNIRKYL